MMRKLLKRLLEKEEGQSLAEYMVLFPGAIMLPIAMLFSLGPGLKDKYCDIVNVFSYGVCAETAQGQDGEEPTPQPTWEPTVQPFTEPDGSTFCHCEIGEGEGALGLKNCHPVRYNDGHDGHYYDYWSHDGTCEGWHDSGLAGPPPPTPSEPTPTPTAVPETCTVLEMTGDCSQCDANPADCICLPGINAGSYEHPGIESLVIFAGKEYHIFYSGFTDDGCYYVNIDEEMVWWEKYMNGQDCKKIDHLQAWKLILCPGPE
jgi:hypothetical protein